MKTFSPTNLLIISYLILVHLIFLGLTPLSCLAAFSGLAFFELSAQGTREWVMLITSLLFPVVAIATIISAWYFYTRKSYKKAVWINLVPVINIIGFCSFQTCDPLARHREEVANVQLTAQEAYRTYLNLELPDNISDFKGKNQNSFPVYPRSVRFIYHASPAYLNTLRNHHKFIMPNEFNTPIHEINCTIFQDIFQDWLFSWQEKPQKMCFVGVFFPYVHYLIYDKITGQVDHVVEAPD